MYFLPRPRAAILIKGSFDNIVWPAEMSLAVRLSPEEVFGPSQLTKPRMVLCERNPYFLFESNVGRVYAQSNIFLPNIDFNRVDEDAQIKVQGNVLTLRTKVLSLGEAYQWVSGLEYSILTFMSLSFQIAIRVEEIIGNFGEDVQVRYIVESTVFRFFSLHPEQRAEYINNALEFAQISTSSFHRFLLACMYFQQALRLESPHETSVPSLNVGEIALNLAKAVEVLFSSERDKIRQKCSLIGYSDAQIESQIIPILVIRSQLDVAHAAGTAISEADTRTIHDYIRRSVSNVRNLLLRVGSSLKKGIDVLDPLPTIKETDRRKICVRLRKHLKQPMLPEELSQLNNLFIDFGAGETKPE